MSTKFRLLGVILIALGTTGIGANSVHAEDHQVPFFASYAGTVTFGAQANFLEGTGRSTHLGRSTDEATVVITAPPDANGCIPNVQTHTLTAANGDTLTLTNFDLACPEGPGLFHGTGEWQVTGGTGRFSGATGGGTLSGHIDFIAAQYTLDLSGGISAPNSH